MNWTGGCLQQSKRNQNGITAKQRSYFAKSRLKGLAAKRTAPVNHRNHGHPHEQSIRLYTQAVDRSALTPPEWLPKELCDSFLQTQSRLETRPREAPAIYKHRKRRRSKEILLENEETAHLKDPEILQTSKELEDEAKRQNLLRQKDWFTMSKSNYKHQPVLQDRSQIGKRRKLKQDDLARMATQHRYPTNKPNLSFASADSMFKPSQASIRLGSQIHGTQRTTLSASKVHKKATPVSDVATTGLGCPSATSHRSFRPPRQTPLRSIASFQTLEEIATPLQDELYSGVKRSKIETWISESALKGKHKSNSGLGELINDKQIPQSPQSLSGEPGSLERGFQQQRKLSYKDASHWSQKKRKLESNGLYNREQLSAKHILGRNKSGVEYKLDNGPKSRQTEVYTEEIGNFDAPIEQSTASFSLEPKTINIDTIMSRHELSPSPVASKSKDSPFQDSAGHNRQHGEAIVDDQISNNPQGPEKTPSSYTWSTSSYANMSTRDRAGNKLPKVSPTLNQRQNEKWLQWIINLRQRSQKDDADEASQISKQESCTSSRSQSVHPADVTPISFKSTQVHTGNTPKLETRVEESKDLSVNDLDRIAHQSFEKNTATDCDALPISPHISSGYFETPIAQQSTDVSQPTTPVKLLIQKRSVSRDGKGLELEAIDLREKFLQAARLPCQVHPKLNTKRSPMVKALVTLPPICQNQIQTSQETRHGTVHAILHNDGAPLSKSVSRSLVFIRPQRFKGINPDEQIRIGRTVTHIHDQIELERTALLDKGNLSRDDIED